MRVTFVLPGYSGGPIGGFRVVYEYASGLARRGHEVTVLHPRQIDAPTSARGHAPSVAWLLRHRPRASVVWAQPDPRVRLLRIPWLTPRFIPSDDVVVATAWQTAEVVARSAAGAGVHLVYDYEFYRSGDAAMRSRIGRSLRSGLQLIATSQAVTEMLIECGVRPATTVTAAIDHRVFRPTVPPADRAATVIGFPARRELHKGLADALTAFDAVRRQHGQHLRFNAFGRPGLAVPEWVELYSGLDDGQLSDYYNALAMFVVPSHYEGWGLPGLEAMGCGTPLITTANGGAADYARSDRTALVVPPGDPTAIAEAVSRMLTDEPLRRRLAEAGIAEAARHRWEASIDSLESFLVSIRSSGDRVGVGSAATGYGTGL
jgi:glycosyltransferase involved in cell wall biosynthesis